MRIGVLSDTRQPTVPHGGHGLGRAVWDIATYLKAAGHTVTLYAGPGSAWDGDIVTHSNETQRVHQLTADASEVWVDCSHYHDLSQAHPDWRVVNYLLDGECRYNPPNNCGAHPHGLKQYGGGRIIPLGIDVDTIPLATGKRTYLTFCAKLARQKGVDLALKVEQAVSIPLYYVGSLFDVEPPANYRGVIDNDPELYAWLGGASALLSPYRINSAGRVNLEAAACGTPVLCIGGVATEEHVKHCVSGYVCADVEEMIDAVQDVSLLDPTAMREWVKETHDIAVMGRGLEAACQALMDGEAW